MADERPPDQVRRLADARRAARAERSWAEADRLKAEIEAAGWKVIDQGRSSALQRGRPPDVVEDGAIRYGSSESVPSVLDSPPDARVSVVRAVPDAATRIAHEPRPSAQTQVVLVASHPVADLPPGDVQVILLNGWPGAAAARNAGLRRARGEIVVVADPDVALTETDLDRLVDALADPEVGVAGGLGLASDDLRRFAVVPPGDPRAAGAVAVDGRVLAFRRADFARAGPLDEAFVDPFRLDVWWSLALRDRGPDAPPRVPRIVDLGLAPPVRGGGAREPANEEADPATPRDRDRRRNFYRLIRQFGGARHLYGS